MGIRDFVDKAKEMAGKNKDKVKDGIEKAGDVVDEKTGGEHTDKIEQGEEAAKNYVEDLDED